MVVIKNYLISLRNMDWIKNKILTRSTSMPVSLGIENNIHVRWTEFRAQLPNRQKICKKGWIKPKRVQNKLARLSVPKWRVGLTQPRKVL